LAIKQANTHNKELNHLLTTLSLTCRLDFCSGEDPFENFLLFLNKNSPVDPEKSDKASQHDEALPHSR